jgi:hypothetical protein
MAKWVKDLMELLDLSQDTVLAGLRAGRLPGVQAVPGGAWRITDEAFETLNGHDAADQHHQLTTSGQRGTAARRSDRRPFGLDHVPEEARCSGIPAASSTAVRR